MSTQGIADAAFNRVHALVEMFCHHVPHIVHYVAVVAGTAGQRVCPKSTVQEICSTITHQYIVQRVPNPIKVLRELLSVNTRGVRIHQCQVFHIRAQGVALGTLDGINALACGFKHQIFAPNHVGVVACPTGKHVDRCITHQHIVERIPGGIDCRTTRQDEILHIGAKGVGD